MNLRNHLTSMQLAIDWFNTHLKGATAVVPEKPVHLYIMGADEWRDFDDWPPPAEITPFYLREDSLLGLQPAATKCPPDQYRYDPANPTPNMGGALLSTAAGPVDNRPLEARQDVLVYTTPPLERPLTIIGPVKLTLYVHSSRDYTDFFGRLCVVEEDGRSLNICDGICRVSPHQGEKLAKGVRKIDIEFTATAYQFQPNQRMRLQVSSGAHPRFARNLGTGEPTMFGIKMVAAEQTIYHDAKRPSALWLPVS